MARPRARSACAGLRAMGADVDFLVPNRFEYGYGLTPEIVAARRASARRGSSSPSTTASRASTASRAAAARGIDVLITDHHLPGADAARARRSSSTRTSRVRVPEQAPRRRRRHVLRAARDARAAARSAARSPARAEPNLAALLDLVALGTVADVVRLDHVNRILVEQGLRAHPRRARASRASRRCSRSPDATPRRATRYDLGFVAGPRLNAAGRLADMSLGIRCLLADDRRAPRCRSPRELDRLNRERRDDRGDDAGRGARRRSTARRSRRRTAYTLCLFRPDGIRASSASSPSRLKDRFHRPAIVFARGGDGELQGLGPLDRGLPSARRARPRGEARARA